MRSNILANALLCIFLFFSTSGYASIGIKADVKDVETQRGIKYWFLKEETFPLVSLSVVFKGAGYSYDPAGKKGIAALVSSLVFSGTVENGESFAKKFQDKGISLGFYPKGEDIHLVLKTLSENFDEALMMLRECLLNRSIDDQVFVYEKERQKTEIRRGLGEPEHLANSMLESLVFGDHPYSNQPNGTIADIERITIEDVQAYMSENFDLDNMLISVVGSIDQAHLSEVLDTTFMGLERGKNKKKIDGVVPKVGLRGYVKFDSAQSVVAFSGDSISPHDPDYVVARILNNALGGTALSSVLMKELRQKLGITYHVGTSFHSYGNEELFAGILYTDSTTANAGVEALLNTLRDVKNHGLDERSFEIAKADIVNSFMFSFLESASIAELLTKFQLLGRSIEDISNYAAKYEAATLNDVNQFAKQFLGDLTIVEVGMNNNIGAEIVA